MSTDPYVHFDAAYAFGALDADDRVAFETHLLDCPDCRARLADAHATMTALAAAGDAEPPPDTLLPGLLRRAKAERRRHRTLTAALGAVAAACVVALAIALWPSPTPDTPPSRPFVAAVQSAPVEASAMLVAREWGTEINIRCRYTRDLPRGTAYRLVVVDTARQRYDAGGWTLSEKTADFTGGTQVQRGDIASVQITLSDGRPILQLTP